MNPSECLKTLRKIKDVAFATVDRFGNPQIRIIDIMIEEDNRLYFVIARGKDVYRELSATGRAAVAALTESFEMIRAEGSVRRLEDRKAWIDRVFLENPSMSDVYPGDSRYILEPFCLEWTQIEYFDLGRSPIYRESWCSEGGTAKEKGFWISDDCSGCGVCVSACPQGCISQGAPCRIDPRGCLHCGLCFELCPAQAVIRKGE